MALRFTGTSYAEPSPNSRGCVLPWLTQSSLSSYEGWTWPLAGLMCICLRADEKERWSTSEVDAQSGLELGMSVWCWSSPKPVAEPGDQLPMGHRSSVPTEVSGRLPAVGCTVSGWLGGVSWQQRGRRTEIPSGLPRRSRACR